jgi:NAD(P)-dependent dehydrogenase (short-subunit alcohol dehydrogenase family)
MSGSVEHAASIHERFAMKRDKSWNWRRSAATPDFKGLNVAMVGGTGGIGRALSRYMATRGANVTVVGQTFRDADTPGIRFLKADLGLMREARRVVAELPAESLDLVVFTTGIFAAPQRQETAEGIERDMAVSYLSRLVILDGIAPRLGTQRVRTSIKPRTFVMGYPGSGQSGVLGDLNAEHSYKAMAVHMNTVAGNEMLVLDAARRYPNAGFFGLNPGLIKTNIRDNFFGKDSLKSRVMEMLIGLLTPTADAYAERIAPLLVSSDLDDHNGALFNQKGQPIAPSPGMTDAHIRAFIAESEALIARASVHATTSPTLSKVSP